MGRPAAGRSRTPPRSPASPHPAVTSATPLRFGNTAIALHWVIALLIFAGWGLGACMVELKLSPAKLRLYSWHKWIGVSVFLLVCVRAAWRATHPAPPDNPAHPAWQRRAARLVQVALYLLMFALPLSGWVYSSATGYPTVYLGLLQLPDLVDKDKELAVVLKVLHLWLGWALAAIITAHVIGALQHHVLDRDDTLARMLPAVGRRRSSS